jgi:hypothetical protein
MKRFLVLCLLTLLLIGAAVPVFAQVAITDLAALARFVPDKAPVYIGFRTDDDYLATLDAVAQRINAAVPDADIPPLFESLDDVIGESGLFGEDATFASAVRSWLGAAGSISILSVGDLMNSERTDPPVFISLEVTDRAAAESFWSVLETTQDYTRGALGDYTLFSPPASASDDPSVAIGDNIMFVASVPGSIPSSEVGASLLADETFSSTLALLPESRYNFVVFANLRDVMQAIFDEASSDMSGMSALSTNLAGIIQNYPPIAFGATNLDARSFAIDFALPLANLASFYEDNGISPVPNAPLNPLFRERIPAGTPLVAHGADLQAVYRQAVASVRIQMQALAEADDSFGMEDFERGLEQASFVIQGATGLDLETALLPALTGDYALYLGLNPALAEATRPMEFLRSNPVDFGLLLSVNDPAVIATLVTNLTNAIRALPPDANTTIEITPDTIGSSSVNVITVTTRDLPFPLEIVLGGDDEVVFIGTPAYARAALNPDGGLLANAAYREAASHILTDERSLLYMASAGLQPLVNVIRVAGNPTSRDADAFAAVLGLLSSATISSGYADDTTYARFVWTFPE